MSLCSKFRGCLVGGLLGDCLGAPFEGESAAPKSVLNSYFKRLEDPNLKVPYKSFTDDTAMTRSIASSIVDKKKLDEYDMAKRFVIEYFNEPHRGYGQNVVDVFAALRATKFKDIFAPAAIQFGGTGSYGNGAAMRVAPVALFCYSDPTSVLAEKAKRSALITHANRLGFNGAVLQCIAVHEVMKFTDENFDTIKYLDNLSSHMEKIEKYAEDEIIDGNKTQEFVYVAALSKIRFLLEKGNDVSVGDVDDVLGTSVAAHQSAPTAIYAFLRAQSPITGVTADNPFQRTIHYAISLGGDTDTIAAMAGNIAGAYYGIETVPEFLQKHCEGLETITNLAEELYKLKHAD